MNLTRVPTERCKAVVLPDLGCIDQHSAAVANVMRFVGESQPDEVRILENALACPTHQAALSKLSKPADWFDARKLVETLTMLREHYQGRLSLRAPVASAAAFGRDHGPCCLPLSELDELDVDYGTISYDSPDWVHGYVTPAVALKYPGQAAIGYARMLAKSFVAAGTGLLGLINERVLDGGQALWGMEIGTLRRPSRRTRNVQMGFGVVDWDGRNSVPRPIPIDTRGGFDAFGLTYD